MAKAAFNKRKTLFIGTLDLNLWKNLMKSYIRSIALYCAKTGTVRAVDKKQLESFEMWCWRRMEQISWTYHVGNEEVLLQVMSRGISYKQYENGRITGLATSYVETAF